MLQIFLETWLWLSNARLKKKKNLGCLFLRRLEGVLCAKIAHKKLEQIFVKAIYDMKTPMHNDQIMQKHLKPYLQTDSHSQPRWPPLLWQKGTGVSAWKQTVSGQISHIRFLTRLTHREPPSQNISSFANDLSPEVLQVQNFNYPHM